MLVRNFSLMLNGYWKLSAPFKVILTSFMPFRVILHYLRITPVESYTSLPTLVHVLGLLLVPVPGWGWPGPARLAHCL